MLVGWRRGGRPEVPDRIGEEEGGGDEGEGEAVGVSGSGGSQARDRRPEELSTVSFAEASATKVSAAD